MRIAALIVAAGRGTRAGAGELPKQYRLVRGRPMLAHSIGSFADYPGIGLVQVAYNPSDRALYDQATAQFGNRLLPPVAGGADRQGSVLAGLEALSSHAPTQVLIHDAARPFLKADVISRVLDSLTRHAGAIPAEPMTDTLKREGQGGTISGTVERAGLWRAQTPQGFQFPAILEAHRRAAAAGQHSLTDDAAVAEWAGIPVALVQGSAENRKLTTLEDFLAAEVASPSLPDFRTGSGFDVHRFMAGNHVMLCGVRVPHDQGVEAHSDGDVALHALTDALLGAIGAGDIGQHFPPSDPKWRGADSALFVTEAARLVRARGGRISNADVTILCERPRIGPFRQAMVERMAAILEISPDRVNLKATTTEKLGFTGRGEGLAAMATVTVLLSSSPQSGASSA